MLKKLAENQRWSEIVQLVETSQQPTADMRYYHGLALARLERWQEAEQVFQNGRQVYPRDKRFLLELAGLAFQRNDLGAAKSYVRAALRLGRSDKYANDFLGTVYLLEGNYEAAAKYWNRVGKPQVSEIGAEPGLRMDPVLLDRAFTFSPASVVTLEQLWQTQRRLRLLGVFSSPRFEFLPQADGSFDLQLRARERNRWGNSTMEALVSVFRGLPYQTVHLDYFNARRSALNFTSMFRWDAQKRRATAALSTPLGGNPSWQLRLSADARDENWDISPIWTGAVPPDPLKLHKAEAGAEFRNVRGSSFEWSSGFSASRRYFPLGSSSPLVRDGYVLSYHAGISYDTLRLPEHRLTSVASGSAEVGRFLSGTPDTFSKAVLGWQTHWFPRSRDDDYATRLGVHSGKTWGDPPFDELFILGLERGNNLWLRGHTATRHGRKGGAPMGREFLLFNWEVDKLIYSHSLTKVTLGPFLDSGRIFRPRDLLAPEKWLWDTGAQLKLRVRQEVGASLIWGRDLRSGNDVFYVTISR